MLKKGNKRVASATIRGDVKSITVRFDDETEIEIRDEVNETTGEVKPHFQNFVDEFHRTDDVAKSTNLILKAMKK